MLSFVKLDRVPPMDVIQRLSARRKILDGRELFLTVFGGPKACGFTAWAWEATATTSEAVAGKREACKRVSGPQGPQFIRGYSDHPLRYSRLRNGSA